ncbi:MAG: hypothetical protein AVDCRST_MAG33-3213, partial [uncultured Thermomicrobiales bacterium]
PARRDRQRHRDPTPGPRRADQLGGVRGLPGRVGQL